MLKRTLLLSLAIGSGSLSVLAQTVIDQISTGAGYSKSAYYKLADGSTEQTSYDAWDIAFSNLGVQQAGIFINEGTATSMGQPLPGIAVYDPSVIDFNDVINAVDLTADKQLFNPEISWAEGAFNSVKDPVNVFDYGWGEYNPQVNQVQGSRVFALKLRNGGYKKVFFETYNGQTYQFKVANLDGTDVQTYTIAKSAGNGSPVVYFSFANSAPVTPKGWDLVFGRYSTPLFDGQAFVPYSVTGILSSDGVLTAKAVGVDPATLSYQDYLDSLDTRLDVIGYDWKSFSGTAWSVPEDHAYFVKTTSNQLYKIVFIDFEGSSTGTGTLERTFLTQLTATTDLPAGILNVAVYPNPVIDQLHLAFTSETTATAILRLFNASGQLVWSGNSRTQTGLNVLEINNLPTLSAGQYALNVQLPSGQFSRKITVGQAR